MDADIQAEVDAKILHIKVMAVQAMLGVVMQTALQPGLFFRGLLDLETEIDRKRGSCARV